MREPFRKKLAEEMKRPEWTVPDYDIVHSYYLRNLDDLLTLSAAPEWAELEEEARKVGNGRIGQFVAGREIVQFEDN
jgi:hypothetical protein